MILDINPNDLPLCPNNESPQHPSHTLHNQLIDVVYNTAEHNADGDMVNAESEKINMAVAYGRFSGRMYAYRDSVYDNTRRQVVEAYYFRCNICGLVISAVGRDYK